MKFKVNCSLDSTYIIIDELGCEAQTEIKMEVDDEFDVDIPPPHIEKMINKKVEEWFFDIINYTYSIEESE